MNSLVDLPVDWSRATTSGSPPVRSISLRERSFSGAELSFDSMAGQVTPLWRCVFFSKRDFRVARSWVRWVGERVAFGGMWSDLFYWDEGDFSRRDFRRREAK